jgi:hypothetical protein
MFFPSRVAHRCWLHDRDTGRIRGSSLSKPSQIGIGKTGIPISKRYYCINSLLWSFYIALPVSIGSSRNPPLSLALADVPSRQWRESSKMSHSDTSAAAKADAALLESVANLEGLLVAARSTRRREADLLTSIAQECRRLGGFLDGGSDSAKEKAAAVLAKFFELQWQPRIEKEALAALAEAFNSVEAALGRERITTIFTTNTSVDIVKVADSFCTFFAGGLAPAKAGVSLLCLCFRSATHEQRMEVAKIEEIRKAVASALFLHHKGDILFSSRVAWLAGQFCNASESGADFVANGTSRLIEDIIIGGNELPQTLLDDLLGGLMMMTKRSRGSLYPDNYWNMFFALKYFLQKHKDNSRISRWAAGLLLTVLPGLVGTFPKLFASTSVAELPEQLVDAMALDMASADEEDQCRVGN